MEVYGIIWLLKLHFADVMPGLKEGILYINSHLYGRTKAGRWLWSFLSRLRALKRMLETEIKRWI